MGQPLSTRPRVATSSYTDIDRREVPTNVSFGPQIEAAAAAHHLDPKLLAAVAAQETGGPGANSGRNIVGDGGHGHGIFQIDDRSWSFARTAAAMNPAKNAEMAASILADNLHRYGGDLRAALSAYNSGSPTASGTKTTWADGRVLGYADSVMRHYGAIAGGMPRASQSSPVTAAAGTPVVERVLASLHATETSRAFGALMRSALFARAISAGGNAPLPSGAQVAPMETYAQVLAAGARDGEAADSAMADLIDIGDVFSRDHDDDP